MTSLSVKHLLATSREFNDHDSVASYTMSTEENSTTFENGTVVSVLNESSKDPETDQSSEKCACDKSKTITSAVALSAVVPSSFKIDEVAKNNESNHIQSNCCTYLKQTAKLVWIERIILISICTAVAGAYTVPIIIYALDMDRGDNSTISIDLNFDNCSTLDDVQVCLAKTI